jgi:hypothetical protein
MTWITRNGKPYNDEWEASRRKNREKLLKQRQRFWRTWITATQLKQSRNWTDLAIKNFLPSPKIREGYKVYSLIDVRKAEQTDGFKVWMEKRLIKQAAK